MQTFTYNDQSDVHAVRVTSEPNDTENPDFVKFTISVSSDLDFPYTEIEKIVHAAAGQISTYVERDYVSKNVNAVLSEFRRNFDIGTLDGAIRYFTESVLPYKTDNLGRVGKYTHSVIVAASREYIDNLIDGARDFFDLNNNEIETGRLRNFHRNERDNTSSELRLGVRKPSGSHAV